jgi:hypothetical protein
MSYYESRIWALEAANEQLKMALEAAKLEILRLKVKDPIYEKPLSAILVNYEIVNPKK